MDRENTIKNKNIFSNIFNAFRNPSFQFTLHCLITVSVLLSVSAIAYNIVNFVKNNKYKDVQSIVFFDLESSSNRFINELDFYASNVINQFQVSGFVPQQSGVYFYKNKELIAENTHLSSKFSASFLDISENISKINVVNLDSQTLLVKFFWDQRVKKAFVIAFDIKEKFRTYISGKNVYAKVYISNKSGQLLYSNDNQLTNINFQNRSLVQKFIKTPLNQMQQEIGVGNDAFFGFFKFMDRSNLVVFVELPKQRVLSGLKETVVNMLMIVLLIIIVTLLIMQPIIRYISRPFKELLVASKKISIGEFDAKISDNRILEFSKLHDEFTKMGESLIARDERIKKLHLHEKKRIRLENELSIAQKIQVNLISHGNIPFDSKIDFAAYYRPANEVAGDWYSCRYDKKSGELVVIIADVSGHGAGSSMFTAIVAALFDDHTLRNPGKFNSMVFAKSINETMLNLGKEKWHCTFTCIRHIKGENEVEVMNCGHVFPFYSLEDQNNSISILKLPSTPAGLTRSGYKIAKQKVKIFPGFTMVLYSDGLTETKNHKGKQFGKKQLHQLIEKNYFRLNSPKLLEKIISHWNVHKRDAEQEDDLCVLAIKWL